MPDDLDTTNSYTVTYRSPAVDTFVTFDTSHNKDLSKVKRELVIRLTFPNIEKPVEISPDGSIIMGCNSISAKDSKILLKELCKVHKFKLVSK